MNPRSATATLLHGNGDGLLRGALNIASDDAVLVGPEAAAAALLEGFGWWACDGPGGQGILVLPDAGAVAALLEGLDLGFGWRACHGARGDDAVFVVPETGAVAALLDLLWQGVLVYIDIRRKYLTAVYLRGSSKRRSGEANSNDRKLHFWMSSLVS